MARLAALTLLATLALAAPAAADSATAVNAVEGASFSAQVATFSGDPAVSYSATIDWGDGTTTGGTVTDQGSRSFAVTGTHTYADENGLKTVVTITPNPTPGTTGSETLNGTATVSDAGLTPTATSVSARAQTPFSGPVGSFTDANPNAPSSDFSATIDWGDGSSSSGVVGASEGSFFVSGSHTYAAAGSPAVKVIVTDDGAMSATISSSATVAGPPAPTTRCPAPPAVGGPSSEPASVAASDPNTRFVQSLYRDLLGRSSPAPASEVAPWTTALNGGTTRAQVAQAFLSSAEYRTHLVSRWFATYLRRTALAPELTQFATLLGATSDENVVSALLGSPEYFQTCANSDSPNWTEALYQDLLARTPSASELNSLLALLGGGATRTQVAAGALGSAERRHDLVDAYYRTFLGRPADSGATLLVNLLGMGATDEQVLQSILGSTEYAHRLGAGSGISGTPRLGSRGALSLVLRHAADVHLLVLRPLATLHPLPHLAAVVKARSLARVGTVSLGHARAGRHTLHWNLRVGGRHLRRGRYEIVVQVVSRGRVTDASAPLTLRIR
jgi:hypothetical protein